MEFEKKIQLTLGELIYQIVQLQHENEMLRQALVEAQTNEPEQKEAGR